MDKNTRKKASGMPTRFNWLIKRGVLVIYDIVASYLAFFFALVTRFYANGGFLPDAEEYLTIFYRFFPFYAGITVLVFLCFGLYASRWKSAGSKDLAGIIAAEAAAALLLYVCTVVFFREMPLSYYIVGAALQAGFTVLSRFSYSILHFIVSEYKRTLHASVNVMIVGLGEISSYIERNINGQKNAIERVACFYSWSESISGTKLNGVPVVCGTDKFKSALQNYKIKTVYLSDPSLPNEERLSVYAACKAAGIGVADYTDLAYTQSYDLSFRKLMRVVSGGVWVACEGEETLFESGRDALDAISGNYFVTSVSEKDGKVSVTLDRKDTVTNDTADWIKETEDRTGESVSFF